MHNKVLLIESLKERIEHISQTQCSLYSEACVVALENQHHSSGVKLSVEGLEQCEYELRWELAVVKGGWRNELKVAENAATAIAFFLTLELTEYTVIEEARIGTGVDYWLMYGKEHPLYDEYNFLNARLEISGINSGARSLVNRRVEIKRKQTSPTDNTLLPAYVAVVEFNYPLAVFIKK